MTPDTPVATLVQSELALDGRAAIIRLMRPKSLNALSGALLDQLDAALDRLSALPDLHILILTGSDTNFSVGAEL